MTNVRRRLTALGTLAALGAAIAVPSASAATRPTLQSHSTLTCSTVSPAEIDKLVHLVVKRPDSNVAGPIATCSYVGSSARVLIQYFQPWSSSSFTAFVSNETKAGEKATALSGYGSKADAISIEGVSAGIVVLKGTVGLLVTTSSLANEKTIATYLLPKL